MIVPRRRPAPAGIPALRIVEPGAGASPFALSRRAYALAVIAVVAVGFAVRAGFVLASDFPLNDGGLFYQMVRDLQHNGYALPSTTTYNGDTLPFAYPPLTLYLAGLIADAGMPLADVLRFVPLMVSTATIAAFYLLAREMLRSRIAVVAAVAVFALVPRSFLWMIMGGGITRSSGLLFALLTIRAAYLLYTQGGRRHATAAAVFGSLALLSHIELAWFAAFTSAIFLAAYGRRRDAVLSTAAVLSGVAALTAPWWLAVVARHGFAPFAAAVLAGNSSTNNPLVIFIELRFTNELLFPLAIALGLLGAVACIAARRYVLPCWMVAIALLDSRALGTDAAVPLALLAGIAVADVLVPLLTRVPEVSLGGPDGAATADARPAVAVAVLGAGALFAFLTAMVSTPRQLTGLTADERAAMAWAAANTPPSSRFLIVSGDLWALDRTSEWFPALGRRQSVVTTQGYEWRDRDGFRERMRAYNDAQACAEKDTACIDAWAQDTGIGFDYVYLPKLAPRVDPRVDERECCAALRASLRADRRYAVAYEGPGATVFRRLP